MEKKLPYVFQKYKHYKKEIDPNVTRNEWKTLKQNYQNANNPFFLYKKTQETPGKSLAQVNVYPEFDSLPELTRIKSKRNVASQADVYAKTQKQFENTYNNYVGSLVASGMTEEDADERFWSDYYPNSEMKKLNDETEFQQRYILSGPHGEEPIETVSPFLSYIYAPTAIPRYITDETIGLLTGNQSFGNYASNMAEMAALGVFGRIKGAGQAAKEAWKKSAPIKETPPPPKPEPNMTKNTTKSTTTSTKPRYLTDDNVTKITYGVNRRGPSRFYNSGDVYNNKNWLGKTWERATKGGVSSDIYIPKSEFENAPLRFTEKQPVRNTRDFRKSVKTGYGIENPNSGDFYKVNVSDFMRERIPEFQNEETRNSILKQLTAYKSKRGKQNIPVYYNPNNVHQHGMFPNYVTGRYGTGNLVKNLSKQALRWTESTLPFTTMNPASNAISFFKNRSSYRKSLSDITTSPDYQNYLTQFDSLDDDEQRRINTAVYNAVMFIGSDDPSEMSKEEEEYYNDLIKERTKWIARFGDPSGFDSMIELMDVQYGNKPYDYKTVKGRVTKEE